MRAVHNGLLTLGVLAAMVSPVTAQLVSGGGETIVTGGYGFPPIPVKTNFAFDIDMTTDGQITGHFDCLALVPDKATGSQSGLFTDNVMYVTGHITSLDVITPDKITFGGTATVTGLGAGLDLPFDCDVSTGPHDPTESSGGVGVTPGGPGARMVLNVSGLTFDETLLSGAIRFDRQRLALMTHVKNLNRTPHGAGTRRATP